MLVALERITVSMLAWVGSRCCTRMNAIPVSTGSARSICVKASSPPADAPMPTIRKGGFFLIAPDSSTGDGGGEVDNLWDLRFLGDIVASSDQWFHAVSK